MALELASSDRFPGAVGVLNPFEKLSGPLPCGAHGLARLKGRPFLLGAGGIENVDFGGGSAHVGGGVLDRNFVVSLSTAACALSSGAAAARAAAQLDRAAAESRRCAETTNGVAENSRKSLRNGKNRKSVPKISSLLIESLISPLFPQLNRRVILDLEPPT